MLYISVLFVNFAERKKQKEKENKDKKKEEEKELSEPLASRALSTNGGVHIPNDTRSLIRLSYIILPIGEDIALLPSVISKRVVCSPVTLIKPDRTTRCGWIRD